MNHRRLYILCYKAKGTFPANVYSVKEGLFKVKPDMFGQFDTVLLTHVLEHIEKDQEALKHIHTLLAPEGYVLIEVPALPFLFSVHDEISGHLRRYTKKILRAIVDCREFQVVDMWYQDLAGVFGSRYYFQLRRIALTTRAGAELVTKQGKICTLTEPR